MNLLINWIVTLFVKIKSEQIRIKIEQEKQERSEELKAAEKLREKEETQKTEASRFSLFKKRVKGID